MITFLCKKCGKQHSVPDEWAGKTAKCPCQEKNKVPSPAILEPDAEPAESFEPSGATEEQGLPAISTTSRVNMKRRSSWLSSFVKYVSSIVVAVVLFFGYRYYVLGQPLPFFASNQASANETPADPSQNPEIPEQADPVDKVEPPAAVLKGAGSEGSPESLSSTKHGEDEKKTEDPPERSVAAASLEEKSVDEDTAAVAKSPVPRDSELTASRKMIEEVFGDRIKAAQSAEEKSEVVAKLITASTKTKDQVEKFALLDQAQKLALEAEDAQLCFHVVDTMVENFQVDGTKRWSGILAKLMEEEADQETLRQLAEADFAASRVLAERVVAADAWYDFAQKQESFARQVAKGRAALHYQAALPSLVGLKKMQAQKRLEECRKNEPVPESASKNTTKNGTKTIVKAASGRYGHGRIIEIDCTKGLNALEAQKVQWSAAKAYGVPLETANKVGMRFRFIPAGTFTMGSPEDEPKRDRDEEQHEVKISKPFYIGMTEVTQEQYWKVTGNKPSHTKDQPNNPVEMIIWEDAKEFCKKLTKLDGKRTYCLPTEEQWEYAARAGVLEATYGPLEQVAWIKSNSAGKTHPVGQLASNAWGLYDCLGNVWERCDAEDKSAARLRGGSRGDPGGGTALRLAERLRHKKCTGFTGFRVIMLVED